MGVAVMPVMVFMFVMLGVVMVILVLFMAMIVMVLMAVIIVIIMFLVTMVIVVIMVVMLFMPVIIMVIMRMGVKSATFPESECFDARRGHKFYLTGAGPYSLQRLLQEGFQIFTNPEDDIRALKI